MMIKNSVARISVSVIREWGILFGHMPRITLALIRATIFSGFLCHTVYANNNTSIEFFASNNTQIISMQNAFDRMIGQEQEKLQDTMIEVLQKNHVEQGRFKAILGAYTLSADQSITGDNTDEFIVSPYQNLPDEKIFSIAKELAIALNQESVAVFIPRETTVANVAVRFTITHPNIKELLATLQNKLSPRYRQAFSLHLANPAAGFDEAKVAKIEWLGSKIPRDEIEKAFPDDQIEAHDGVVFLVYQNGEKVQL